MKAIPVTFKNIPMPDGTISTVTIEGCLIANTGLPSTDRPKIQIHLPKADSHDVDGGFVEYGGRRYHVIGTTAAQMNDNTPTRFNRYAIAEAIRML